MKIYSGKNKKEAKQTTLKRLLIDSLIESGFKLDNGSFDDENHSWVGIVQESNKPSQVLINVCFNDSDEITEVKVYETPIVTIVDDDRCKQII